MRWLDRLIGLLEEELALLEEMRGLLAEERDAIVSSDYSRLLSIAKRKETLGVRHKLVEEARLSCLKKAGKEGYTVSQLMEELAPSDRARLEKLSERLKEAAENLIWENKRNALLLNKAIELNRDLMRIFSSCYSLSYGPNGNLCSDYSGGKLRLRG